MGLMQGKQFPAPQHTASGSPRMMPEVQGTVFSRKVHCFVQAGSLVTCFLEQSGEKNTCVPLPTSCLRAGGGFVKRWVCAVPDSQGGVPRRAAALLSPPEQNLWALQTEKAKKATPQETSRQPRLVSSLQHLPVRGT